MYLTRVDLIFFRQLTTEQALRSASPDLLLLQLQLLQDLSFNFNFNFSSTSPSPSPRTLQPWITYLLLPASIRVGLIRELFPKILQFENAVFLNKMQIIPTNKVLIVDLDGNRRLLQVDFSVVLEQSIDGAALHQWNSELSTVLIAVSTHGVLTALSQLSLIE